MSDKDYQNYLLLQQFRKAARIDREQGLTIALYVNHVWYEIKHGDRDLTRNSHELAYFLNDQLLTDSPRFSLYYDMKKSWNHIQLPVISGNYSILHRFQKYTTLSFLKARIKEGENNRYFLDKLIVPNVFRDEDPGGPFFNLYEEIFFCENEYLKFIGFTKPWLSSTEYTNLIINILKQQSHEQQQRVTSFHF